VTRVARTWLAIVVVVAALAGCTSTGDVPVDPPATPAGPPISSSEFTDGFVTTNGTSFELGGRPFRFVGANIYDAAASELYSCRSDTQMSDEQLLDTLQYLHDEAGVTVLRFWAYQTYTQGATYWEGVDRVVSAARSVGLKVIPVLEDGPGHCTNLPTVTPKAEYENDTWYSQGYKVPYGNATLSYRDYVAAIVARYADEPAILGWSMMNEADTSGRSGLFESVLVDFAIDMASVIRSVDDSHLITVGTQSNGAPGASGADFTALYELPQISFAEVHDWGYWGSDDEPMPGGDGAKPPSAGSVTCFLPNAPIGCSFARAADLDKPLLVGESGMTGTTEQERTDRAEKLGAKMDAAFQAGAAGYLIWSVTSAETDGYDVRLDTGDPLFGEMLRVADQVR